MNLLAIDASGTVLSIAVSKENYLDYINTDAGSKQSEIIMSCIDSLVKKAGIKPADLNGVLCTGGPGSFTGLRIGYSIAKGLALSLSIPFITIPTLECIIFPYLESSNLLIPVIRAGKNSFFYTLFHNGERISDDAEATVDNLVLEINKLCINYKNISIIGYESTIILDSTSPENKSKINITDEKCGYVKELINIAKIKNLINNDNTPYLFSGPEYIRKGV
jgi:tRNA threonylcarbamoyladenosine biosynthesis protein TsaB